jgi:signal transduction histidine kinase/ActR/RegA family two-component response regulator
MFGVAPEDAVRDARALIDLIHPDDYPGFSELARVAMAEAGIFRWEGRVRPASGDVRYVQIVAQPQRKPDGTVLSDGLIVDITEQRRAQERLRESEEQLRHTQKMEAVGRLAGGVAHDFNNLITIIRASAGFLLEDTGASDPRRDDEREIAVAADRAAALTRQLLSFSRRQPLAERLLDVNEIVANLRPMLSRLIGEHIAVSMRLHERRAWVRADLGQLEQVLVNLAINARDAMPDGGRLAIETAVVAVDDPSAAGHASHGFVASAGTYVRLAVCDDGVGMTPEIRARIFEPFFTTKGPGKGTGLGLATVYGVVKQAEGHVCVHSAPGEGTAFELFLPLADEAPAPAAASAEPATTVEGSETILLVEDEAGLRALARRILERHGYAVLACADGREALAAASAHPASIDVVLTDVVMPGMSGRAMAECFRAERPDTPVVYMSGYTDNDALLDGTREARASFIQKPFAPAELLRVVREALDAR